MRLRAGAATNKGRVRELNEDAYVLRAAKGLFVVCDGMGGAPAGEVASQIAAETIVRQLGEDPGAGAAIGGDGTAHLPETSRLARAVQVSNDVIYRRGQTDPRQAQMGTTVVGAWLKGHVASVVHVGDSRAYLWRRGHLEAITRDHSLIESLRCEGIDDAGHGIPADQREMLVRVVGGEPDVQVDQQEVPLQSGDYLLLCSDGLTRMVSEWMLREIITRVRRPQEICDRLVTEANRNGGADNITVVVVEVMGGWWQRVVRHWNGGNSGVHHGEACSQIR